MQRLLAIALAALLLACQGASLEEQVAAQPGGLLEVDLYMGEGLRPDQGWLEVRSHDAPEVRIDADATGWGASGVSFRLEHRDGVVRLYGRVSGALSWLFGGPQMAVQVWVPREYSVDLRTSAGPVRVDDIHGQIRIRAGDDSVEVTAAHGDVRLRAGSGDVRVAEIEGDVDVRLKDGAIAVSWVNGDVEARTGSGSIEAAHVSGALTAATGRGEIEIRGLDGRCSARTERGHVFASFDGAPEGQLETTRGDVNVELAGGAGAQLDAISRNGEIELGGLRWSGERRAGMAQGSLGPGGAPLRLYTAHGNVKVGSR